MIYKTKDISTADSALISNSPTQSLPLEKITKMESDRALPRFAYSTLSRISPIEVGFAWAKFAQTVYEGENICSTFMSRALYLGNREKAKLLSISFKTVTHFTFCNRIVGCFC